MIGTLEVTQEDVDKSVKLAHKEFNAIAFKGLMEKFEAHADSMVEAGKNIKVGGPETERKSIELGSVAKRVNKEIDKARMSAKRPYLDFTQQLDGMVRPIQKVLTGLEASERKKCTVYRNALLAKERAAAEQEAKDLAIVEATRKKLDSPLGGLSLGKPRPVAPAAAKVDSMTAGSGSYAKVFTPKLVDISKVPEKYLLVDWKAVAQAQKAGVTKIDGIEFVEEMKMTLRS